MTNSFLKPRALGRAELINLRPPEKRTRRFCLKAIQLTANLGVQLREHSASLLYFATLSAAVQLKGTPEPETRLRVRREAELWRESLLAVSVYGKTLTALAALQQANVSDEAEWLIAGLSSTHDLDHESPLGKLAFGSAVQLLRILARDTERAELTQLLTQANSPLSIVVNSLRKHITIQVDALSAVSARFGPAPDSSNTQKMESGSFQEAAEGQSSVRFSMEGPPAVTTSASHVLRELKRSHGALLKLKRALASFQQAQLAMMSGAP